MNHAERGYISSELQRIGVEIDPSDNRPLEEIGAQFGILVLPAEIDIVKEPEVV